VTKNTKKLSSNDKYRHTFIIGSKIANLLSTLPSPDYENKIEQLNYIFNSWKEGKELFIEAIDGPGSSHTSTNEIPPVNDVASTSCSNSNGI